MVEIAEGSLVASTRIAISGSETKSMAMFPRGFVFVFLPVFAFAAPRIWKPTPPTKQARSVADRVAWTIFTLGVCLMFNMVLFAALSESEGDFRTWETIAHHRQVFLVFALLASSGPLLAFLFRGTMPHPPGHSHKKPPSDDFC